MPDLHSRIGPKVGQDFPNKSWVRPGYEPPKSRPKWNQSEGYGSDISEEYRSVSPEKTPKPPVSLLSRMGLENSPSNEEEQTLNTTSSFKERVGIFEPENSARDNIPRSRSGSTLGNRQDGVDASENAKLDLVPTTKPPNDRTDSNSQLNPATTLNEQRAALNSDSNQFDRQTSKTGTTAEHPPDSGPNSPAVGSSRQPQTSNQLTKSEKPNRPQLNTASLPSVSNHGTKTHNTTSEDGEVASNALSPSSPEDGEVSPGSLPPDNVRALVLPLVLRIAADRIKDTESGNISSQSPPPVNTSTLTDTQLTSFAAKATTEVRRDMRALENKSRMSPRKQQPSSNDSRQDVAPLVGSASYPQISAGKKKGPPLQQDVDHDQTIGHHAPPSHYTSPRNCEAANQSTQVPSTSDVHEFSSSRYPPRPFESWGKRRRSPSPDPQYSYRGFGRSSSPERVQRPREHAHMSRSSQNHDHETHRSVSDRPRRVSSPQLSGHRPRSSTDRRFPRGAHSPISARDTIIAEPMTGRSTSPTNRRNTIHEMRSPVRAREVYSPPMSPIAYSRRSYHERGRGQRGRRGGYYGSEYRDAPYEKRLRDWSQSRTPRGRSTLEHYLGLSSKKSWDRADVSYNHRSKSPAMEDDNVSVMSLQRLQRQDTMTENIIQESPTSKALQAIRHNTPQNSTLFWEAKRGLNHLGILKWTLDLDESAATRLNIKKANKSSVAPTDSSAAKSSRKTSLKLACFTKDDLIHCINANIPPAQMLYSGPKHTWPTSGHLIVKVNQELSDFQGKTYMPKQLSENKPPIVLDYYIQPGQNILELVQLSAMDDKVFWLSEQDILDPSDLATTKGLPFLADAPVIPELISTTITPATVTILDLTP